MSHRIIPVVITPFTDRGGVSREGMQQLYSYLAGYGVKTIFAGGSYGAFALMSREMRVELAHISTEAAHACNVKSIFNIGSSSLDDSLWLLEKTAGMGIENVATLAPYYYSAAKFYKLKHIVEYLRAIVQSSQLPVYFYNNPKTTSLDLTPAELHALCDTGIVGIKDSNETFAKLLEIADYPFAKPGHPVQYIPGTTASMLIAGSLGMEFCMSGIFLSFPKLVGKLFDHACRGEIRPALELYRKCMKVREIMGRYAPRAVSAYYILRMRGVDAGEPKFPWPRLDKGDVAKLKQDLDAIGAL